MNSYQLIKMGREGNPERGHYSQRSLGQWEDRILQELEEDQSGCSRDSQVQSVRPEVHRTGIQSVVEHLFSMNNPLIPQHQKQQ